MLWETVLRSVAGFFKQLSQIAMTFFNLINFLLMISSLITLFTLSVCAFYGFSSDRPEVDVED